eukprot:g1324.t1
MFLSFFICIFWFKSAFAAFPPSETLDSRDTRLGPLIGPLNACEETKHGCYLEQPYCVVLPTSSPSDANSNYWSCVATWNRSSWAEGSDGEQMVGMQSHDHGQTWSKFVDIEQPSYNTTRSSSYGSVFARPDGSRIFAVYVANLEEVEGVPGAKPSNHWRADMLMPLVWKYSDNGGISWSTSRFLIPTPKTAIDRNNTWKGEHSLGWEVDHPIIDEDGAVVFAFTKIGTYAVAPPENIYIVRSKNILTAEIDDANGVYWKHETSKNKNKGGDGTGGVLWEMLPASDNGIGPVGGNLKNICEEPHVLNLPPLQRQMRSLRSSQIQQLANNYRYYVVFRTGQGYLGSSISTDQSKNITFSSSTFARYAKVHSTALYNEETAGVKNPRGPISPKKVPGKSLWITTFYNNAGLGSFGTADRALMWISVGWQPSDIEAEAAAELTIAGETVALQKENVGIVWSQPELLLFDRTRNRDHGYPDVLFDNSSNKEEEEEIPLYITETFKGAGSHTEPTASSEGRTHTVDPKMLHALYSQKNVNQLASGGTVHYPTKNENAKVFPSINFAEPKSGGYRFGATISMWVDSTKNVSTASQTLFDTRDAHSKRGLAVVVSEEDGGLEIVMRDESDVDFTWKTDSACSSQLREKGDHYVAVVIDGAPMIVTWFVDGKLCDGGAVKPQMGAFWKGWEWLKPSFGLVKGRNVRVSDKLVKSCIVYDTALFNSELVGNFRAGIMSVIE